jgi:hypothetical protein
MKGWGGVKGFVQGVGVGVFVVRAREASVAAVTGVSALVVCTPAVGGRVLPSTDPRGVRVRWGGQARLPRRVSAPVHAHDGMVGHGQVGRNRLVDRTAGVAVGDAARRARSLVVSEPHAAVSSVGARQRISPSRRP